MPPFINSLPLVLVMILMTPPKALVPYKTEAGPLMISTRETLLMFS